MLLILLGWNSLLNEYDTVIKQPLSHEPPHVSLDPLPSAEVQLEVATEDTLVAPLLVETDTLDGIIQEPVDMDADDEVLQIGPRAGPQGLGKFLGDGFTQKGYSPWTKLVLRNC